MLLGKLLVQDGVITPEELERALSHQRINGGLLGIILVNSGVLDEKTLVTYLVRQSKEETHDQIKRTR